MELPLYTGEPLRVWGNKRKKGFKGEELAVTFLEDKGFRIVERNFYTKWGEIDIIAEKDNALHFIEVRTQKGLFDPSFGITKKKISSFTKAIEIYIKKRGWKGKYKAHLITIVWDKDRHKIEFIEDFLV